MSVSVMGLVWASSLKSHQKFVALALADFADDGGSNIYPAVATIALKVSKTQRAVQATLAELKASGILLEERPTERRSRYATNRYRLDLEALGRGEEVAPLRGEVNDIEGCSPPYPGVKPTSPDPSVIHPGDLSLTREEQDSVDSLHRLSIRAGLLNSRPPWGEDLARNGMTKRDVEVAVNGAVTRGKASHAYIAAIVQGRIDARAAGNDPDARAPIAHRPQPAGRGDEHEGMPRAV